MVILWFPVVTIPLRRWLVGGGRSPDDFSQNVQEYNNTVMCGLVWTANFVAFRCQTCRISQCMSLCADCFRHGNHEVRRHIIQTSLTPTLAGP